MDCRNDSQWKNMYVNERDAVGMVKMQREGSEACCNVRF